MSGKQLTVRLGKDTSLAHETKNTFIHIPIEDWDFHFEERRSPSAPPAMERAHLNVADGLMRGLSFNAFHRSPWLWLRGQKSSAAQALMEKVEQQFCGDSDQTKKLAAQIF